MSKDRENLIPITMDDIVPNVNLPGDVSVAASGMSALGSVTSVCWKTSSQSSNLAGSTPVTEIFVPPTGYTVLKRDDETVLSSADSLAVKYDAIVANTSMTTNAAFIMKSHKSSETTTNCFNCESVKSVEKDTEPSIGLFIVPLKSQILTSPSCAHELRSDEVRAKSPILSDYYADANFVIQSGSDFDDEESISSIQVLLQWCCCSYEYYDINTTSNAVPPIRSKVLRRPPRQFCRC